MNDRLLAGCVLYEMCTRNKAFDAKTREALVHKIVNSQHPRLPCTISEELQKIYECLMQKDPDRRPSASDILSYEYARASNALPPTRSPSPFRSAFFDLQERGATRQVFRN